MPIPDGPFMGEAQGATAAWTVLPSWLPVPGLGNLAVNSFLLKGTEPVLVDTGLAALSDAFLEALWAEVDPGDLRWIWLSHMDADHVGNLSRVLERASNATVVTTFLGRGKMGLAGLDVDRVRVLEPGAVLTAGGHRLHPVRPPYYDAPETIGFFDETDRAFFSADSFGALLPEPVAGIEAVPDGALRDGLVGWSSIDAPWLATVDRQALGRTLRALQRLDPAIVLSGHLPLARRGVGELTAHLADAYGGGCDTALDPLSIESVVNALA